MKTVLKMDRPTKLTTEIQPKIGNNIALGLTYGLAANAAGITYQTLNQWLQRGANREIWEIFSVI